MNSGAGTGGGKQGEGAASLRIVFKSGAECECIMRAEDALVSSATEDPFQLASLLPGLLISNRLQTASSEDRCTDSSGLKSPRGQPSRV